MYLQGNLDSKANTRAISVFGEIMISNPGSTADFVRGGSAADYKCVHLEKIKIPNAPVAGLSITGVLLERYIIEL